MKPNEPNGEPEAAIRCDYVGAGLIGSMTQPCPGYASVVAVLEQLAFPRRIPVMLCVEHAVEDAKRKTITTRPLDGDLYETAVPYVEARRIWEERKILKLSTREEGTRLNKCRKALLALIPESGGTD